VAALVVSRGASAAVFDVFAVQQAVGSTQWDLSVSVAGSEGLAALNILFSGVSGMVLNPLATGISTSDSLFIDDTGNPGITGAIIQGGASGANSLPLFASPTTGQFGFLLATLTGTTTPIQLIPGEFNDTFAGTAFITPTGAVFAGYSLTVIPAGVPPVPEPTVAMLLGMGLAGLALVRRKA
jgi:hypothetical protein